MTPAAVIARPADRTHTYAGLPLRGASTRRSRPCAPLVTNAPSCSSATTRANAIATPEPIGRFAARSRRREPGAFLPGARAQRRAHGAPVAERTSSMSAAGPCRALRTTIGLQRGRGTEPAERKRVVQTEASRPCAVVVASAGHMPAARCRSARGRNRCPANVRCCGGVRWCGCSKLRKRLRRKLVVCKGAEARPPCSSPTPARKPDPLPSPPAATWRSACRADRAATAASAPTAYTPLACASRVRFGRERV